MKDEDLLECMKSVKRKLHNIYLRSENLDYLLFTETVPLHHIIVKNRAEARRYERGSVQNAERPVLLYRTNFR